MEQIKLKKVGSPMTPDMIASRLFSYHSKAHLYHLQTLSFAQHKMLEGLYEALEDSKDSICEYLLGIQAPKRFSNVTMDQVEPFSEQTLANFLNEGFTFSVNLCTYAKDSNLEQLCNMASDLQGEFTKARYLNTLK